MSNIGWVATIAAYAMWTHLLKRHPANRVAPFSLGVPVVGLTAGVLVLGETITSWQWAGIALVVLLIVRSYIPPGQRWWIWSALAGLVMGLFGLWYVPYLKRARARSAQRRASRRGS